MGVHGKFEQAEDHALEDRIMGIIRAEEQKEKNDLRKVNRAWRPKGSSMWTSMHIMGRRRGAGRAGRISEDIMVKTSHIC